MTRIRETALLLGAMLLLGAQAGCGKVANGLTDGEDGGPSSDGGGGRRNGDFDGSVAASGAGNGTSRLAAGGNGGVGMGAGQNASIGGASNGGAAGGTADAASSFPDPHGPERKALITQFCSAFDAYPCLEPTVIVGDTLHLEGPPTYDAAECGRELGASVPLALSPGCWDEWVAAMKCVNAEPHQCPCAGTACFVAPLDGDGTATDCAAERQAVRDCYDTTTGLAGMVKGSRMPCAWSVSVDGATCDVDCYRNQTDTFNANCVGAPGGPYDCTPALNGRPLVDDYWNNSLAFVSDTCEQAAQTMADGGGGVSYVDCCITWVADTEPKNRCSCTDLKANNMLFVDVDSGFATCADAAASGHGMVVDLCPQYAAVTPPGFPGGP
jgi:hypothetical protein